MTCIKIEFDVDKLSTYNDDYLAALWHAAQFNPAPQGDPEAGRLTYSLGTEIIRRWLSAAPTSLHAHQARTYYWDWLRRFASYEPPEGVGVDSPDWHRGRWVLRTPPDYQAKGGE